MPSNPNTLERQCAPLRRAVPPADFVPTVPQQRCNADACEQGRRPCPAPQACQQSEGTGTLATDLINVAGILVAFALDRENRPLFMRTGLWLAAWVAFVVVCWAMSK